MQHADRKCIVKYLCEGQMINVCLNDINIFQLTGCGKRCFHCRAKIDAKYISNSRVTCASYVETPSALAARGVGILTSFGGDTLSPVNRNSMLGETSDNEERMVHSGICQNHLR